MMNTAMYAFILTAAFLCAGPYQSEEAFYAGLKEVRELMAEGEWAAAKEKLAFLLEEHRERPYVRGKQAEIEDCIKTCTFWSSFDKPEPDDVISGELLMYDRSAESIRIRYVSEGMGDFSKEPVRGESKNHHVQVHPALFSGPYTIEIKGASYPLLSAETTETPPTIDVCREGREGYSVVFGFETVKTDRAVRSFPGYIHHWKGIEGVVLCKEDTPVRAGRSFKLKVKVGRKDISAYYNGRRFLRAKKPDDLYGGFAFRHIPFDEILIQGKIQPAWLQALCDKKVQKARAEFEKTYEPERHLPEWMTGEQPERPSGSTAETNFMGMILRHGPRHPKQMESLAKVITLFEKNEYEDALEFVKNLPGEAIHEATREFVVAILLKNLGDYRKALDHCNRACDLDPDFIYPRMMRALLHARLRQKDMAVRELRGLIDESPGEDAFYHELARILLSMERYAEAREVIYRAAREGLRSPRLDRVSRLLAKSLNGPTWRLASEIKSQHYHIMTNIDRKACHEAEKVLEESYMAYTLHLQKARGVAGKKFKVYLFAGEPSYKAYLKDLRGISIEHTYGVYMSDLRQLLIWNQPDRDAMMRTVRHEGFHQYLHSLMEDPPRWLNEGLAQYYEIAVRDGGRWKTGQVHPEFKHMLELLDWVWVPLEHFVYMGDGEFMKKLNLGLHYAQSWAFVHFLLHSSEENRRLFDRLFDTLQEDLPTRDALDKAFGGIDWPKLQVEFERHARSLT